MIERISYDAYGNGRHHSSADLDGDGDVDGWDQALLLGAWGDDVADIADIDRNGDVDGWDQALLLGEWGAAMPAGWITRPGEDNIIGFAGYVHNKEAPGSAGGAYLARHRWYDPLLGRWLSRDPAGYVDGMNMYLYVAANPLVLVDPLGLAWWSLDELCDGVAGFFGGSGIDKQRDNASQVAARQKEIAARLASEGKMTGEEAAATEEYLDQGMADVDNAITDVHQARADAAAAVVAAVPGGAVVAAGMEVANAGVDVAQGQYGDAAMRGLGAAGGHVLGKGLQAAKGADDVATEVGGRLGNQATRQHVGDVAAEMESRGWNVTGGGGRYAEEYIPGHGPGTRGSAYPDITGTKNGHTLRVNTIDTISDGVTPTAREMRNAAKIRVAQKPGDHLILIPKP